jgi:8-oxo-dGTP pyrophosphatase MutT (NUDIX family)
MSKPWRVTRSTVTYHDPWLKVRSDQCVTEDGTIIEPYHVLEFPAWVNVVALTEADEIVLVREYRHGASQVLTGLPSGRMEPTDPDATSAARRELLEETGFDATTLFELSSHFANPANQDNVVHTYLAIGARDTEAPSPDPNEEIQVVKETFVEFLERFWSHQVALQNSHAAAIHFAVHAILGSEDPRLERLRATLLPPVCRRYRIEPTQGDVGAS